MNKNGIISGFIWRLAEKTTAQLVSFVVSIILARILMPEEYGIVAIVLVFINIADIFVTSGLSTALIQKKDASFEDFSCIFILTLGVSTILYMILFFAAPYIASFYDNESLTIVIRVFSIKVLISAWNSVQNAYVSRHMLFRKFFFSTITGTIISGCIGIIMVYKEYGVWALVAQYLLNAVMNTLVLNFTIDWKPQFYFSWKRTKPLVKFGIRILIADLFGTIYNNLRALLIGKFYSSADLAYYNKGKQIPELLSSNVDTSISSVLFPAMSNHSNNYDEVKRLTKKAVRTMSFVSWPIMLGLCAVAEPLIILLLTEKWRFSIIIMQILCISKPLDMITNANLQAIKAVGRSDIVLKLEFVKKPVGLLLIIISLRYSVKAVAFSLIIYDIYATIINMIPNKKLLKYGVKEQLMDIIPFVTIATIMAVIVGAIRYIPIGYVFTIIIQTLLGIFLYISFAILFKIDVYQELKQTLICTLRKEKFE